MLNSIHKKPRGNYAATASNNLHSLQTIWYWNASIAPDVSLLISIGNKHDIMTITLPNTTTAVVNGYHRSNQIKKKKHEAINCEEEIPSKPRRDTSHYKDKNSSSIHSRTSTFYSQIELHKPRNHSSMCNICTHSLILSTSVSSFQHSLQRENPEFANSINMLLIENTFIWETSS